MHEQTVNDTQEAETKTDPLGQALRGFAIGVAEGAMSSSNPSGRMFGAAMSGAMAPVYEQQRLELERIRARADEQDYQSMSDPLGMDAAAGFEMVEPSIGDFAKQITAMQHKGFRDHFGSAPEIKGSNITLNPGLE